MLSIFAKTRNLNLWILFYIVLGVIQAMWTNENAFPPQMLRVAMMVAVFLPILIERDLVLFAIPFAIILRGNLSTSCQYLPDVYSYSFYIIIEIAALVFHCTSLNIENLLKVTPLIILMLVTTISDLIFNSEIGKYSIHIFIGLLLIPFIKSEKDLHSLAAAFISVCTILAVYYILMYDKFLVDWNKEEQLEHSGWNDPNYFATILDIGFMTVVMYVFGILKSDLWIFKKKILIAGMVFITAAVVMAASRAGFICLGFTIGVALLFSKVKFKYFLLAIIVMAAALYYMYSTGLFDLLLFRLFEEGNMDTGGARTRIWERLLRHFVEQPFYSQLTGGGYWHRADLTNGYEVHNEFLAILADYGIVGETIFLAFICSMYKFGRDILKNNIPVIFYILSIMSLSPFQFPYVMFLILFVYANKWVSIEQKITTKTLLTLLEEWKKQTIINE